MTVLSADGLPLLNPIAEIALRASGDSAGVAAVAADEVAGFGAMRELVFELAVTAVSLTGAGATLTLTAWVQRRTPSGQWDDLLALKTAALISGASPAYHVADHRSMAPAAPTPAAVQDAGGSPPFASRGGWVSDALRVKSQVAVANAPTAQSVTWSLVARGRP